VEKLGLIGGVSWISTMEYYRRLNLISHALGGRYMSAELVLVNLNFEQILASQRDGNDDAEFEILLEAGRLIEHAGVGKLLICSNTTSNTCDRLKDALSLSIINIIDATVQRIRKIGARRVGLLGTRYVMERDFYRTRLKAHDIEVFVPSEIDRQVVHSIIYNELCLGIFSPISQNLLFSIIGHWARDNIDAVILGCTEIPLIVPMSSHHGGIPIIDSIDAHIEAALGKDYRPLDQGSTTCDIDPSQFLYHDSSAGYVKNCGAEVLRRPRYT
jgi:aspartate racemase